MFLSPVKGIYSLPLTSAAKRAGSWTPLPRGAAIGCRSCSSLSLPLPLASEVGPSVGILPVSLSVGCSEPARLVKKKGWAIPWHSTWFGLRQGWLCFFLPVIACVLSRHESCRALAWSIGRREGFRRFRRQISPLGSSLLHCRCRGPSHAQQLFVGAVHVEVGVIFVHLTCACVAFSKIPAPCLPSPPPAPSTGSSAAKQPPGGQAPCRWCRGHAVSHGSDTQACFPIRIPSGKRPARAASAARVGFAASPPPSFSLPLPP